MVDELCFCREHLDDLSFDELQDVYNCIGYTYADNDMLYLNDLKFLEDILEDMLRSGLTVEDWYKSFLNGNYCSNDDYVNVSDCGIVSFNDLEDVKRFVGKKLKGESLSLCMGFLENKNIIP